MSMFGGEPVFDVDMNSMRDGLRINTLLRHATCFPLIPRVEMGDYVKIRDEDGSTAYALVDRVDGEHGERIRLKVDWSTWHAAASMAAQPSWTAAPFDASTVQV